MSSKIDIINLALNHLGVNGITSLTEQTPAATAANNFYIPSRDDVFREYRWPFATVRETLTLTTAEILGWNYVYQYPVKASTVWSVFDEGTVDTKDQQEFEVLYIPDTNKKVICSNLQNAYAEMTYRVEDTTLYDSKFIFALSYKLAGAMSHILIGSPEIGIKMSDLYNMIIAQAKTTSYAERLKKPRQVSSYQNSRG